MRTIKIITSLFLFILLYSLRSSAVFAGGGPQFVCKDMAIKQGWLVDNSKSGDEISSQTCINRQPSVNEKEEILGVCKSEEKGDSRSECLSKCQKYYSADEFQMCDSSDTVTNYSRKVTKFLNSGSALATATIALVVVSVFFTVVNVVKKQKLTKFD